MNPLASDLDHILSYTYDLWEEVREKQIFMDRFVSWIYFSTKYSCLPMRIFNYPPSLSFSYLNILFPTFLPQNCIQSMHADEIHSCNSSPNPLYKLCLLFILDQKVFSKFSQWRKPCLKSFSQSFMILKPHKITQESNLHEKVLIVRNRYDVSKFFSCRILVGSLPKAFYYLLITYKNFQLIFRWFSSKHFRSGPTYVTTYVD